jgi:hypothetical protein
MCANQINHHQALDQSLSLDYCGITNEKHASSINKAPDGAR